jgi:5-oxoprolinase (ATP-hydrolysing)
LDVDAPKIAVEELSRELVARGIVRTSEEIAEGFFAVANHAMAEAIRQVSVARGYDVRDHALVIFGGAGGQHACSVARLLGIRTLIFHPLGGVLSAYGMGLAETAALESADAGRLPLTDESLAALGPLFADLERRGREAVRADGFADSAIRVMRKVDVRRPGTEASLTVPFGTAAQIRAAFDAEHERLFGYTRPGAVELWAARVESAARRQLLRCASRLGLPIRSGARGSGTAGSGCTTCRSTNAND